METLFVWRRVSEPGWIDLGPQGVGPTACPACTTALHRQGRDEGDGDYVRSPVSLDCPLCGWAMDYVVHSTWVDPVKPLFSYDIHAASLLREFDVSSPALGMAELGAFLRRRPESLNVLHWRRFEELVADVYGQLGFHTVLTQPSADEGADVIVLHNSVNTATAIIECKRYAPDNRVGVALVRTLVGAAVQWDVRRATLVTTSDFTRGAKIAAHDYAQRGYDIDLVAASDLLSLLEVYNPKLAPLPELSAEDRAFLVAQNKISP